MSNGYNGKAKSLKGIKAEFGNSHRSKKSKTHHRRDSNFWSVFELCHPENFLQYQRQIINLCCASRGQGVVRDRVLLEVKSVRECQQEDA